MNIFSEDEVVEVKIEDIIKSNDKSIIIKDRQGESRSEGRSNLEKEIIANDALELGASKASIISGVAQSSASKYSDGLDIGDDETRARVLQNKFNIADTATAKLMETLGLFNPSNIEKPTDIIRAAQSLATIVEKVSSKDKNAGNEIHLHMYSPKQKSMDKYQVIDV